MNFKIIVLICCFPFLTMAINNEPQVVFTSGHNTQVNTMAVSDNAKFLASAGNNKLIKIWDMASSKEFRTMTGSDGRVQFLDFNEDNRTLLAISSEDEMIAWDVVTGEKLFEVEAEGSMEIAAFFAPNSSQIYFVNADQQLSVFDSKSKATKVILEDIYCTSLNVDFKTNRFILTNHLQEVIVVNLKNYEIIKKIPGGKTASNPSIPDQLSKNGRFLVSAMTDNSIRIMDVDKGEVIFNQNIFGKHIHSLVADPNKTYVYIGVSEMGIVAYDYQKQKIVGEIMPDKDISAFDFNSIAVFPKDEILLTSNFDLIQLYDFKSKKFFKRFEPKVRSIFDMAYDQNDKYLAIARDKGKVEVWDLSQNKVQIEIPGLFPCQFSPDGSKFIVMNYTLNFIEYDTKTWKVIGSYKTNSKLNSLVSYSKNGKYIAAGGYMPNTIIYDTQTKKPAHTISHTVGITNLAFHPNRSEIAYTDIMGNCKVINYQTNAEVFNFTASPDIIGGISYSDDGKHFGMVTWGHKIKLFNASNYSLKKEWEGHTGDIVGLDFNVTGDVMMTYASNQSVFSTDNSIIFWKLTGDKIVRIEKHTSGVTKAFFDKKTDYVFSASDDGSIMINSYKEKKVLATLIATKASEFIIYTHDNYYMAAKDALNSIAFRVGQNLVPFEQYDIVLNRPDIVGKIIGKTPPNLLNAYQYLYKKRLRKYNLDEGSIQMDFNLPQTKIENTIPITTDKNTVEFSIKAWDEKYPIKQINVYVNNSPVFGEEGIRPKAGTDPLSFRYIANIALLEGVNKIDISCINANGTESLYATKEIAKSGAAEGKDFYIATIGVSKYKDEKYNLTYPTKDATEIAEALQFDNKQYETVHVKPLLNEQVTVENIRALTQFFEACKPGDVAAIFIAGHGLLDENFDYYFGTYNVDFANPSVNGLPYTEITKLLNSIKAYQKLLIMDTCHSGELDKEEVTEVKEVEVESGDIQFRSVGSAVSVQNAFGSQNMSKLSSDLFSDTRKGTGATVISSAGGAEYAIESDEWQNGLFTYNFIQGFKERKADANGDGLIQISEIRAYVNKQVAEMSNNKQKPTAREENIAVDIVIY